MLHLLNLMPIRLALLLLLSHAGSFLCNCNYLPFHKCARRMGDSSAEMLPLLPPSLFCCLLLLLQKTEGQLLLRDAPFCLANHF